MDVHSQLLQLDLSSRFVQIVRLFCTFVSLVLIPNDLHPSENTWESCTVSKIASSRRSASWGVARKTAKTHLWENLRFLSTCFFTSSARRFWRCALTERLEEAIFVDIYNANVIREIGTKSRAIRFRSRYLNEVTDVRS